MYVRNLVGAVPPTSTTLPSTELAITAYLVSGVGLYSKLQIVSLTPVPELSGVSVSAHPPISSNDWVGL